MPLSPAALALEGGGLYGAPDWISLGLILAITGGFLLANGVLFRDPRGLLEERFAKPRMHLGTMRALLFHRVQTMLGFAFLLFGFALQLYGRRQAPVPPEPAAEQGSLALWIGLVVLVAVALELAGWWWSQRAFQRHLRAFLRENALDLDTDAGLARELGELFGVESHAEDTVQSYVARLRRSIGIAVPPRAPADRTLAEHVPDDD
jgi:hypothetical protein